MPFFINYFLYHPGIRQAGRLNDRIATVSEFSKQDIAQQTGATLMRKTHFMIYPSLYEGIGMPLLEAMQVGTPVVASHLTAIPEVTGGAALLVDPFDVDDITETMAKLLGDDELRGDLIRKGKEVAKGYSWQRTSEGYLAL